MITKIQLQDLAKYYRIDNYTIMREYLQLLFLSYLYQDKISDRIYFKGGTAIRLLFGSSRFSEDLDFSTTYSKSEIKEIIYKIKKSLQREIPAVKIVPLYLGKNTSRYRLVYQPEDFKYPLTIRIDLNEVKSIKEVKTSALVTKFTIVVFPLINHLSEREILAEKLRALITRAKGRDFFDVWFLLKKGIKLDKDLLKKKLKERARSLNKEAILKKIENTSNRDLERDLSQFLPASQRKIIPLLKTELNHHLEKLL